MKSLTVLIPFYNEERTIGKVVNQLAEIPAGVFEKCIFINDGSTDDSMSVLNRELEEVDIPFSILSKTNGGKASAIKAGSELLETTHVVILDSDLELLTADIERLWSEVSNNESDYVFGYRRFLAQSSFTWRYSRGNQLISNLYGIFFNEVITDIMCGYKLVPSDFLKSLPFKYKKFALEIEIPMQMWLIRERPFEIEVAYKARSRSEGKSISVKDAFLIILNLIIFRIKNRRSK